MAETRRWLAGLRRSHVEGGALDGYVADRGITGAVWDPSAFAASDYAGAVASLVEAGARPDASLLWDLCVTDVREAADSLRAVHRADDGADGYAVLWLHPDRLGDPGRAAAAARDVIRDVNRENVAVAFAWSPARAGVLSAVVAEGVAVAVSGTTDVRAVTDARDRGMERRRKAMEDEEVDEVTVFLLGSDVALATEVGLLAQGRGAAPRVPGSADDERRAFDAAVSRMASGSALLDEPAPEQFADGVEARCVSLERIDLPLRVWERDHKLWRDDPEISDRLGWLDVAHTMREGAGDLKAFAHRARSGGVSRVVLLGMGGSSLGAETLYDTLGGGVRLTVLDSTDPDHVEAVRSSLDLESSLFVVSSKSGTTVETLSHLEYLWSLVGRGERFVAITDAGTPLAALARERGFLRVFENPPDIGGRYSVLSYFGLVPAALCGIDVESLLDGALAMATACAACVPAQRSPGVRLGAAVGDAAADGRDKLTLVLPPGLRSLGPWVEQLVAESLGKEGTGVVPVVDEELGGRYGDDRVFVAYAVGAEPHPPALEALEADHPVVRIRVDDPVHVGAELYRWELATAVAGKVLGINPFDQPDVESAKQRTREALNSAAPAVQERGDAGALLAGLAPPEYVAIQAFVAPSPEHDRRLRAARAGLRERLGVVVTAGFGPRFLHSTGQLHKGGPDTGVFLQVTGPHRTDVPVPGRPYTFGRLIDAQADGDLRALRDGGRRAARVTLEELELLAK